MYRKSFFDRYRDLSEDAQKPTSFEDCAKMYRECAAAAKYENNEEKGEDVEAIGSTEVPEPHTDEEVTSEQTTKEDDGGQQEPELNNELGRQLNLRRLIMLRADQ